MSTLAIFIMMALIIVIAMIFIGLIHWMEREQDDDDFIGYDEDDMDEHEYEEEWPEEDWR
jgi:hypothetical protein